MSEWRDVRDLPFDEQINWVPSEPEHCRACGSQLVVRVGSVGFARETGQPKTITYRECPRFARSWRNLWWGGWGHDSLYGVMGCREWA